MICNNCGKSVGNETVCPFCGKSVGLGGDGSFSMEEFIKNGGYSVDQVDGFKKSRKKSGTGIKMPELAIDKKVLGIILAAVALILVIVLVFTVGPKLGREHTDVVDDIGQLDEEAPTPVPTENPLLAVKNDDGYICVRESGSWFDANSKAEMYGGNVHLVTFNSREEFVSVCRLAESYGLKSFWAGMRVDEFNEWFSGGVDLVGEPFDRRNVIWLTNEPSGYDKNLPEEEREFEDCMVVMLVDGQWVANDAPGNTVYTASSAGYVLEIEDY